MGILCCDADIELLDLVIEGSGVTYMFFKVDGSR